MDQGVYEIGYESGLGEGQDAFITGKVSGNDERSDDMRRVQYFLYMQVIDVETSEIRFQAKSEITKAVK